MVGVSYVVACGGRVCGGVGMVGGYHFHTMSSGGGFSSLGDGIDAKQWMSLHFPATANHS